MQQSESIAQLATALSAAQGKLTDAAKSSKNPHFNSKYADLAEVLQTARPVLSDHGLSLVQTLSTKDVGGTLFVAVTTQLCHKSGEWIRDTLEVPVPKKDAQGVGNASTYGRRYGAAAIIGISQDDDDGNSVAVSAQSKAAKSDKTAKAKQAAAESTAETIEQLTAEFAAVKTKDELTAMVAKFTALSPADQAKVLPAAQDARKRLGLSRVAAPSRFSDPSL